MLSPKQIPWWKEEILRRQVGLKELNSRLTQATSGQRPAYSPVVRRIKEQLHVAPPLRDWKLRAALRQWLAPNRQLPLIHFHGTFSASREGVALKDSFDEAQQGICRLPEEIRGIEGFSGQKYRSFVNNLVRVYPDPHYLEIGSWGGSTATAALYGNSAQALCIDNWSQFGGPRSEFFSNMDKVISENIQFRFLEQDFRRVDFRSIGQFNIYLFDGPHEEADQCDGITLAQPALLDPFILIVDDWNWRFVRIGTFKGLIDAKCYVESSIEIRTTRNNRHPRVSGKASEWHNGYFLAVVHKGLESGRRAALGTKATTF